jgi:hypothetical protein
MHRSPKRIPGIFILYFLSFLHISTKFGSFLRFFYSNNKIRKRKTSAHYRVSFGPRPQPAGSAQRPIRPDRPAPGRGAAEGSRGVWRLHAAGGDNGEARARVEVKGKGQERSSPCGTGSGLLKAGDTGKREGVWVLAVTAARSRRACYRQGKGVSGWVGPGGCERERGKESRCVRAAKGRPKKGGKVWARGGRKKRMGPIGEKCHFSFIQYFSNQFEFGSIKNGLLVLKIFQTKYGCVGN